MSDKNLKRLETDLKRLSRDVAAVQAPVDRTHRAVSTAKSVLTKPAQLSKVMKGLISKAKTLNNSATFLSPFPVIGTLAGRIGKILRSVTSAAEKTKKAADQVDRKIKPAKTTVKKIAPPVKKAKQSLDRSQALLQGWLSITGELRKRFGTNQPAHVEVVCSKINQLLAPELKAIAASKAGLTKSLNSTSAGLEALAKAAKPVEDSLAAANKVADALRPLSGPLNELKKALRPVKWALDAVAWVMRKVIDPIVNEILKAVGLNRLVAKLERALNPFAKHLDPLRKAAAAVNRAVAKITDASKLLGPLGKIPALEQRIVATMKPLQGLTVQLERESRAGRKKAA